MEVEVLQKNYNLLRRILNPEDSLKNKIDLSKLEKLIFERLPQELGRNAPPNFPELYFDFKQEYERFREFILYEKLIGRNVLALGGGFSSGKSTFLNNLLGSKILPAAINPSTSVPAYLVQDREISVFGINTFHSRVDMELSDVKEISHGFGDLEDGDGEVTLGHILESIFISTPNHPFQHIAFLDTPGYSKAESSSYSAKTDERIARTQLNSSNYILWFVQAEIGTITEEDIAFLNTLNQNIPRLIIVNKADKVLAEDIRNIVEKIKNVLDIKGVPYLDVLTYSRKPNYHCDREKILAQIEVWNKEVHESRFAYNFKVLFTKCCEYYDGELEEEGRRLNRLNKAATLSENDEVSECLNSLIKEIQRSIGSIKKCRKALEELQTEFFTEIKRIGDQVNIHMPEPSEIDLIRDKNVDPKAVLDEYIKKKGIRSNPDLITILQETLENVQSIAAQSESGSQYNDALVQIMRESLSIDPKKIKFPFADTTQRDMVDLMTGILGAM